MTDDKRSNAPLAKVAIVMILVVNLLVFLRFLYAFDSIRINSGILTASEDQIVYSIFCLVLLWSLLAL